MPKRAQRLYFPWLCHQRKILKLMPAPRRWSERSRTIWADFLFCYGAFIYFFVFWKFCRTIIFCDAHFKRCRAEMDISDPYRHFVVKSERYFQGYYLKLCRSKDIKVKKFTILPAEIAVTPDEVYDTYVDISDDLEIDCNIYNMLIAKAKYWITS